MEYPVTLTRDDNKTILVSFPDFPEGHTFGNTREEALARAQDALATVIDAYIQDRREIPAPSRGTAPLVSVPALAATKVRLYETMRREGVGKAELARRLHWHLPQVDRLIDVYHGSRLDQLESAFSAMGKRIVISVEDVDAPLRRVATRKGSTARRNITATPARKRVDHGRR